MKRYIILAIALLTMVGCSEQKPVKDYSWERDLNERLHVDFTQNEEQIKNYISRYIPDVSDEQLREWEESKALEYMMLDGQKRYFRYAGQNLFRIDKECSIIKNGPASGDPSAGEETAEERHINQIMDDVNSSVAISCSPSVCASPTPSR